MGIDDAKHGLELHKCHISIVPVGDGILLSQYILIYRYVNRLMYKFTSLRRSSLVMVYLCLTVEQHLPFWLLHIRMMIENNERERFMNS